jgi:hypothetical protein
LPHARGGESIGGIGGIGGIGSGRSLTLTIMPLTARTEADPLIRTSAHSPIMRAKLVNLPLHPSEVHVVYVRDEHPIHPISYYTPHHHASASSPHCVVYLGDRCVCFIRQGCVLPALSG